MTTGHRGVTGFVRRFPNTAFFAWFFTVGQGLAFAPRIWDSGVPQQWFIIAATVVGLLLPAVVITAIVDGREGVRELRQGIVKLGGPAGVYVVGFIVMPLLAVAPGAGFGTSYLKALYPSSPDVVGSLHVVAIAVVGAVIIAVTRGRLGMSRHRAGSAATPGALRQRLATGSFC